MHDLHVERFIKNEPGDGPIKTFTLRGIKDSPLICTTAVASHWKTR